MGNLKRIIRMRVCAFALLLALITIYLSSTLGTEEDSSLGEWGDSRVERSAEADGRKRMKEKNSLREVKKKKRRGTRRKLKTKSRKKTAVAQSQSKSNGK